MKGVQISQNTTSVFFLCHFYVRSTQNIGIFQNQPKEALVHVLVHVIMTLCTLVCQYDHKIQNQVT